MAIGKNSSLPLKDCSVCSGTCKVKCPERGARANHTTVKLAGPFPDSCARVVAEAVHAALPIAPVGPGLGCQLAAAARNTAAPALCQRKRIAVFAPLRRTCLLTVRIRISFWMPRRSSSPAWRTLRAATH